MLSKPSSTLPVFEKKKLLVVAGEGWGSSVERCSYCARLDESLQRRKVVPPFPCKDSSSVLTCLVFLRSNWQDLMSLQWREVLWACCQCSLQFSTVFWAQKKSSWGQAALLGGMQRNPWRSKVEGVEGVEWEREHNVGTGVLATWLISGGVCHRDQ